MKRIILTAFILVFVLTAVAQTNTQEIDFLQSVYGMKKKELVAKHMKLQASQADVFWQIYDEYEISRKEIALKRLKNIEFYAETYESLSNENADELMKTTMEIKQDFIKLWTKTYKKISKSIDSVTAAQFIQAEMFFEEMIRQELYMEIPFIGEFEMN
jgi:hypothetical protein